MPLWCPSCGKPWEGRQICPDCLTDLVSDPTATIACPRCGKVWPARMQSCPSCLAELRVDPIELADAISDAIAVGARLPRPPGLPAFRAGPDCTLLRLAAGGGLVFAGPDGLVEATIASPGHRAVPPLTCEDVDGAMLFRLVEYEAADDALVARDAADDPLGTYLAVSGSSPLSIAVDVRDETSAPVARLQRAAHAAGYSLVATGGAVIAECHVDDVAHDGWIDDEWSFRPTVEHLPLQPFAAVALVLAAKVLIGRAEPAPHHEDRPDVDA